MNLTLQNIYTVFRTQRKLHYPGHNGNFILTEPIYFIKDPLYICFQRPVFLILSCNYISVYQINLNTKSRKNAINVFTKSINDLVRKSDCNLFGLVFNFLGSPVSKITACLY